MWEPRGIEMGHSFSTARNTTSPKGTSASLDRFNQIHKFSLELNANDCSANWECHALKLMHTCI